MYAKRKEPCGCSCAPSTRTLVDLAAKRARRSPPRKRSAHAQFCGLLEKQHQRALGPRVFGQPVLAPWQLHALQHDPRLRTLRIMRTPSTWYLPPQPTPRQTQRATGRRRLRGAWRPAQAWATPRTLSSARLVDSEDQVDVVYMVLAATARTHASLALCSATHPCAGKTFSKAGSWQPSCFRRRHVAWNPFKGSTSNGTLNPKSLYLGWLGRANLATQGERLGGFYPRASNHICTP